MLEYIITSYIILNITSFRQKFYQPPSKTLVLGEFGFILCNLVNYSIDFLESNITMKIIQFFMENIDLPEKPELLSLRMIIDIQTDQRDPDVEQYFLDDFNIYERVGRRTLYKELAKIPLKDLFINVEGYNKLSEPARENFLMTIDPFLHCQGKCRLVGTFIHHIEDRKEPEGIRVYLMEHGEMGYQYFNRGVWG